jgi:hypothetical protein
MERVGVVRRKMIPLLLLALLFGRSVSVRGDAAANPEAPERSAPLGFPFLDVRFRPGAVIPLFGDGGLYHPGGGVGVSAQVKIPGFPRLYVGLESGLYVCPVRAATALLLVPGALAAELRFQAAPRWELAARLGAGGFLGLLAASAVNPSADWGAHVYLSTGGGTSVYLSPAVSLSCGLSYQHFAGLVEFGSLFLGAAYHVPARGRQPLQILDVETEDLLPVLYRSYADRGAGSVVVRNAGRFPISELEVRLQAKPYTTREICCASPEALAPGDSRTVGLKLLLNDRTLGILEGTTVSAEMEIAYAAAGVPHVASRSLTLFLHDRNAMIWDDDRKAAVFVSEKDPPVLRFAGLTAAAVGACPVRPINTTFRMAMGLHAAVSARGVSYVIDPRSPYTAVKDEDLPVDFLRFPRQTLKHGAGDCDDLSVLYCALLEAVGIESAFITVPGHIFTAFDLEVGPEEARRTLSSTDDLIFRGDTVWVPVETTEIEGGFLEAWRKGAEEWREAEEAGSAALYPMHACWSVYPPVSLLEGDEEVPCPTAEAVARIYGEEARRFISRELEPRVQAQLVRIRESNESAREINRLGVLYARYGLYDQAEEAFLRTLKSEKYRPALVNLGNLYTQREELEKALAYYQWAHRIDQSKPRVLLHLTETCYRLGLAEKAREYFDKLREAAPRLAGENAYLSVRPAAEEPPRERSGLESDPVWEDE